MPEDADTHPKIRKWIFVTGAPRSATTFVGQILSGRLEVDYIHEPFNPDCGIPGIDRRYLYFRSGSLEEQRYGPLVQSLFRYDVRLKTGYYENDSRGRRLIKGVIGSRGPFFLRLARLNPFHTAAVIKDPIGCLLTEYLAERFKVRPVIVVRHPVPFVASTMRLGWSLDLQDLLGQPTLMEDYFADDARMGTMLNGDRLAAAALFWRALNKVLLAQAARHPDWIVITHEALNQDPVAAFRDLYVRLGLGWTERIENRVRARTGGHNKVDAGELKVQNFNWNSAELFASRSRTLTPEQRGRIFDLTRDVALGLYDEASFGLGPATGS